MEFYRKQSSMDLASYLLNTELMHWHLDTLAILTIQLAIILTYRTKELAGYGFAIFKT